MFEDALRYPYSGGDGLRSIAIGSALTLLGVFLIPLVLVWGYSLRVMREVAGGATRPPMWNEWGDLFVDGLRAFVTGLVYLLVPSLLVAASVVAFVVPIASQPSRIVSVLAILVALASVPLFLLAVYALPGALVLVAVDRRIGAALSFRRVWRTIATPAYAMAWLLAFLVSLLAGVVSSIAAITLVGGILSAVVGFYALVAISYLYAHGVEKPAESDADTPPAATEPP